MRTLFLFLASMMGFGATFAAGALADVDGITKGEPLFWVWFLLGALNIGGVFAVAAGQFSPKPKDR